MKQSTGIIKFKKRKDINIGIVIFLFIFVYLIINIYIFFTKSEIPIYEVQPGTIYSPATYRGVALREEQLNSTTIAGYINYYFREGDRVAQNETVYSIDSDRNIYDLLAGDVSEIKLSSEDVSDLKAVLHKKIAGMNGYRESAEVKTEILSFYQRLLDETLMEQLNEIVLSTGVTSNFHVVRSESSGIISYATDEYSNLTREDITAELFSKPYTPVSLYTIDLVAANTAVYKIITSDEWSIVVMLDETMYQRLSQSGSAAFTINTDKKVITAPISCFQKDSAYFAEIKLSRYMTNYTENRFLDVTFQVDDIEGLKIPESAITLKDYYRIPSSYFVSSGNAGESTVGLIIEEYDSNTGEKKYTSFQPEIFYSNDGFTYIDTSLMNEQTYIVTQDLSVRTMLYTFITKVEGAYNINKGYAVFRRVERLHTADNYCIVKKNSVSGLSAYDHIALDASEVQEGAVIY